MQLNTIYSKKSLTRSMSMVRTSKRLWFTTLAFGAMLAVQAPDAAQAQAPRTISYQGLLKNQGAPLNGPVTLTINYYVVGNSTSFFSETFNNVQLVDGVYSIQLGSIGGGFPQSIDFNQPVEIGVQVNNGAEMTPRTRMSAVPYAFNAYTLNGIPSSPTPVNGTIFPLPLDGNGHIVPSLLPSLTLNGLNSQNNNFEIVGGQNINVTTDSLNRVVISGPAPGTGTGITSITAGNGLFGGGSTGDVTIGISPNGITGGMIAPGAITGRSLDSHIAANGLSQDALGNLNVNIDTSRFSFTNNQLTLRNGVPVIGSSGTFTTLLATGNVSLGTTASATTNTFGTGGNASGVSNEIGSTGPGSLTRINGGVLFTGTTDGGGAINLGGNRLQNVGAPINGTDAATRAYVDSTSLRTGALGGDLSGTTANALLNANNPGIGNRVISALNNGTTMINDSRVNDSLTVNGGTINNTPIGTTGASTGAFTTLSSTGTTTLASGAGAITTIGNTTSMTNVKGGLALTNTTLNYTGEVNGAYLQSFSTGTNRSTGVVAEATASAATTGTRPSSNAVLGVAKYTGAINGTNQIVGVAGKAEPGNGITAIGTVGEASNVNALPNTGVLGYALNSTSSNVGVLGSANATQAQLAALVATAPNAGVYAYNPNTGATSYALQTNGNVSFGNARLQNVATPTASTDAATKAYVDSSTTGASTLAGDVTGTTGNNTLATTTATGNRVISGINNGTSQINGSQIIPNFGSQAVTGGAGSFTTLNSSGLTTLATGGSNVGIGTAAPGALLDVQGNSATATLARFYNTGTGASTARVVSGAGALQALEFTDANEYISSVTSNAANGLMFNVAPANTGVEATLNGSTKLLIDRLGNIVFTGNSINFSGSRLENVATPIVGTDAANKAYVDNSSTNASNLAGDVTGTTGNNTLGTTTATGNRVISGINNGTSQINGSQVIPNFGSQAVTGGAGSFTTLSSTGTTTLASGAGSVTTIGSTTGSTNVNGSLAVTNTTLNNPGEVNAEYVQSFSTGTNRSTGIVAEATASAATTGTRPSSNAVLGVAKYTGAINGSNQIVGVAGKAEAGNGITSIGLVGQADNANALPNVGLATLASGSTSSNVGVLGAAGASTTDLSTLAGTIPAGSTTGVYAFVPASANGVNTSAIIANNATSTGTAINVVSGGVRSSGAVGARFADNVATVAGTTTTVISNSLVTASSTIIVTLESGTPKMLSVSSKGAGTFTVTSSALMTLGDRIDYIIINP